MYVFFGESVKKVKDWDDFNSLPVSPLQNGNEVERVDGACRISHRKIELISRVKIIKFVEIKYK